MMKDKPPPSTSGSTRSSHDGSQTDQLCETTMKLSLQSTTTVSKHNLMKAQELITQTIQEGCPKRSPSDFTFLTSLGEGAYSQVFRCKENETDAAFAIKVLQKDHLLRHDKMDAIIREKNILLYLTQTCEGHPFITQLYTFFHDSARIYFVMNLVEAGDLSESLCHFGSFDSATTKFFASEILVGLQFLHEHNIIHRDLKPENVLIQQNGHISLADFGCAQAFGELVLSQAGFSDDDQASSKLSDSPFSTSRDDYYREQEEGSERRTTFVGTALYVSPEMLSDGDVGPQTDIWGLGCIMYQCLSGQPPFRAVNQYHLMKKIKNAELMFPEGFPKDLQELVASILVVDPNNRITREKLKDHQFFHDVDWVNILTATPPVLHAYCPATFGDQEYYSTVDGIEPGFDDRVAPRNLNFGNDSTSQPSTPSNAEAKNPFVPEKSEKQSSKSDARAELAEKWKIHNQNEWRVYTPQNLILKYGYLNKKRGLFARRRMFLLTEGPHLLYIDEGIKTIKGEIPWTPCMQVEYKNPGTFFIHTPNRVYYLFDPEKTAAEWCKAIEAVRKQYATVIEDIFTEAMRDGTFGDIYGKKKTRKEMVREQKALVRKQEQKEKEALKAEKKAAKKKAKQTEK
ncbi:hypothetical protein B9Z55_022196 [Caenorhabditis nigoni]|uniref:3-phosphoinositide-dependent protein kinase 1 n=1 Tax=Caenorhabditis nigoni TaxID=1611254 RepID=A0A2G5SJP5_9PELO|nr:hypothetical protein B9Z55_022196 [Caenorhabditis nigoni]